MTYYPDLARCDYFGRSEDVLIAVGWCEPSQPLAVGPVDRAFFDVLCRMLVDPWQPGAFAGSHRCGYCRFSGGPDQLRVNGDVVALGSSNLFVPSEDGVFVAPSLIAHYIDAHGYQPPEVFCKAVLGCPEMRSMDYLKALRSRGLGSWASRAG